MAAKELPRADLMLLGMLSSRPMHGYEIAERLGQPGMELWVHLGRTSVYYALGRLERVGLVTRHTERKGGKPERNVYSISESGRTRFHEGLERALGGASQPADPFDVALFHLHHVDAPVLLDRIESRVDALEVRSAELESAVDHARTGDAQSLLLVLEHRLACVRADLDYLQGLVRLLGDSAVVGYSGQLSEMRVPQVLRDLEAAGRTGTCTARVREALVTFHLDAGRLYAVDAPGREWDPSLLHAVMLAGDGTYTFERDEALAVGGWAVTGVSEAVISGSRSANEAAVRAVMVPLDSPLILDVVPGWEGEMLSFEVLPEELEVLAQVDGVRRPSEMAQCLGWSTTRLLSVAFPLWSAGWLVNVDVAKRDLVLVMGRYLQRWCDAVELFAGTGIARRVLDDVRAAALAAGLPDFEARDGLGCVRYAYGHADLEDGARRVAELMRRAIVARFGPGFAEGVQAGFLHEMSPEDAALLSRVGVAGYDGAGGGAGGSPG